MFCSYECSYQLLLKSCYEYSQHLNMLITIPRNNKMGRITFEIEKLQKEAIEDFAKSSGLSLSAYCRFILINSIGVKNATA